MHFVFSGDCLLAVAAAKAIEACATHRAAEGNKPQDAQRKIVKLAA
jgi:hypothetical protein